MQTEKRGKPMANDANNQVDKPVILNVRAELRGAWIAASRAQGMKLTDWLIQRIGHNHYEFDGYSLGISVLSPYEDYIRALPAQSAKVYLQAMEHRAAQHASDMAPALHIATSYLHKRVLIDTGIASKDLFHRINSDALTCYRLHPQLDHHALMVATIRAIEALPGAAETSR